MANDIYVQVGLTALRSPTGEFLPAVPLYVKASQIKQSGLTQGEENTLHDVSGIFAEKHQEYMAELKKKQKSKHGGKKCQIIKK